MDNVEMQQEKVLKIRRHMVNPAIAREDMKNAQKRPRDEDAEPAVQRRFRRQAETLKDALEIQTMMTKLEQDMQKVITIKAWPEGISTRLNDFLRWRNWPRLV